MDGNKKMALLGSAPIPKALLALGIPTMIGMLINALYNMVIHLLCRRTGNRSDGRSHGCLSLGANRCWPGPAVRKRRCRLPVQAIGAGRQGHGEQGCEYGYIQRRFRLGRS